MLFQACKFPAQVFSCGTVRFVCSFFRCEAPKVDKAVVVRDVGSPFFLMGEPANTLKSRTIVSSRLCITHILRLCGFPEIFPTIIEAASIFVIYGSSAWPFASHVKPCKPVSEVMPAVNRDIAVSYRSNRSSLKSFLTNTFGAWIQICNIVPKKVTCFWFVSDQMFEALKSKHVSPRFNIVQKGHDIFSAFRVAAFDHFYQFADSDVGVCSRIMFVSEHRPSYFVPDSLNGFAVLKHCYAPLISSIKRRISSGTVMPKSLARFWSHRSCGSVTTIENFAMATCIAPYKVLRQEAFQCP